MPGQASLKIRPVRSNELPILKDFAPPEWNNDISRLFALYFGQPYFHPIVAELNGAIAGCANGLLGQATGWLGNIIVLPEYRRQGIGSALTAYLVEFFHKLGCTSQVLVATIWGNRFTQNSVSRSDPLTLFCAAPMQSLPGQPRTSARWNRGISRPSGSSTAK